MRRPVLTVEQADDLEDRLLLWLDESRWGGRLTMNFMRRHLISRGASKEAADRAITLARTVLTSLRDAASEPEQRDAHEAVVSAFQRLDSHLDKTFRVVGKRRGSRRPFQFHVG